MALFALFREWIVFGRTYRECRDDLAKFEAEASAHAKAQAEELAILRSEVAQLRKPPPTRRRQP